MVLGDVDRPRLAWWTFGAALACTLGYVVYSFVGTVVFGVFIYYSTRPIYSRLRRRIRPPGLAAAVALFALALPALALVVYATLVAVSEVQRLSRNGAVDVAATLGIDEALLSRVRSPSALVAEDLGEYVSIEQSVALLGQADAALSTVAALGLFAVHLFVMVAIAFYLLRDDHRLVRWGVSRFGDDRGVLTTYLRAVDSDFNSIFFGNILNAILTGTIGVIVYSLLNVMAPPELRIPAAALIGLLAGVASLVPVVGMKLVYVPVAGYLGLVSVLGDFEGAWFVGIFVAVSLVVVDTIPDLVLRPYVSGRSLHVGSVMLAYTLGPLLFGWYGIFLMPMLLVLVFNFARIVLPELLEPTEMHPFSVDPGALGGEVGDASDSGGGGAVERGSDGVSGVTEGELDFGAGDRVTE